MDDEDRYWASATGTPGSGTTDNGVTNFLGGLLNSASQVGSAYLNKKNEKKPKKMNLTPFLLIGGGVVVLVVVLLLFKRK